ncbi:MAG: MFS transporter [Legionellales bacterium]|nr:MFS transporter [Legionellales bacterium]
MSFMRRINNIGFFVWLVCVTFFLYEYFLRTVVGTFQIPIANILQLDVLKFALISSTAYSLIFGFTQIPIGVFLDKYGLKPVLLLGILTCALGSVCFAISNSFESAVASRVLMGFGSAFGYLCVLNAIYEWLPRSHTGFYIGISQGIGTLGPILAAGPMASASIMYAASWREVFLLLALLGVAIALMANSLLNQKKLQQKPKISTPDKVSRQPIKSILKSALTRRNAWMIGLFCGCNYFTIEYMAQNNGMNFLMLKGFSESTAAYIISLGWIGFAIGCPIIGWLSDTLGSRKNVLLAASLLCLSSAIIFIYSNTLLLVAISFIAIGFCCGAQTLGYAAAAESVSEKERAVALGVVNASVAMVMAATAPLIGWVLRHYEKLGPLRLQDYQHAFWVIIGLMTASVAIVIMEVKNETATEEALIPA